MTSAINPNNIDGAYPVAGQDNNSQGFRDNFTNTKTNFAYAADEITDLQNNVILKAALTGTTLNNDMNGSILSNAQLQDMSDTRVALGTLSGTVTINYSTGSYQTVTTNGPIILAFTSGSWPAAGALGTVAVQIYVSNVAHTVTFPTAVSINTTGIQGINTSTNTITFAATGYYTFEFSTSDGGTTISINETNNALVPFNHSGETLANGATVSLAVTTSKISTSTASTATLPDGVEGQIKVFAMLADGGDMVITVTNAGWKSSASGTMTFGDVGDACSMRWIVDGWFCIGNNGVVFA
jgi:hypothetical protein